MSRLNSEALVQSLFVLVSFWVIVAVVTLIVHVISWVATFAIATIILGIVMYRMFINDLESNS